MAKYNDLKTGQSEACINLMGGWNNFLRFIGGQGKIVFDTILELVKSDVEVSAHKKFVVADNFKKGNTGIYYVSENFQKWFGKKVEENVPIGTLSSHRLTESSLDAPIKAELGEGHETYLAWLFEKIAVQADGHEGELLTNGCANIFYIDGRVVCAYWGVGVGWLVGADRVAGPREWNADIRVFSRNSLLESSDTLVSTQV